jgi:hypothetical protein
MSSCKVRAIFVGLQSNVHFLGRFSENTQIPNVTKIRPMVAELLHAGGHDEANSCFSQFCNLDPPPQKKVVYWVTSPLLVTSEQIHRFP